MTGYSLGPSDLPYLVGIEVLSDKFAPLVNINDIITVHRTKEPEDGDLAVTVSYKD